MAPKPSIFYDMVSPFCREMNKAETPAAPALENMVFIGKSR